MPDSCRELETHAVLRLNSDIPILYRLSSPFYPINGLYKEQNTKKHGRIYRELLVIQSEASGVCLFLPEHGIVHDSGNFVLRIV